MKLLLSVIDRSGFSSFGVPSYNAGRKLKEERHLNGNVTYYFGHALTGQGVKHLYKEMMEEAALVYFCKGLPHLKVQNC